MSVTSYDSEYDELNETMRLGYNEVMSVSASPLIESDVHSLASSLPNLAEANSARAKTLPVTKGEAYTETTLRTFEKHMPQKGKLLAAIDEATETNNSNGWHKPGDSNMKGNEKKGSNGILKTKWDKLIGEKKPDRVSDEEKNDETFRISVDENTLDNGKVSNNSRDAGERDSGCVDCHGYKPLLKTRKCAISSDDRKIEVLSTKLVDHGGKDNRQHEKNSSMPSQPNGNVKSKISAFDTKDKSPSSGLTNI